MNLYGRQWTRRELEARVGRLEQIGGIRRWQLNEGREAGVEVIQVRTGAGLCYEVVPSKGLDLSLAEIYGSPISWQSPNGNAHPAYYEPEGAGFLRSATGGLLMTCGLTQVGSPADDEGEQLGVHGRIHHLPANQVSAVTAWEGDELETIVSGHVDETSIFGKHLRLSRTIRSRMGVNEIVIVDEVRNMGFTDCPHMLLYHFNFGFPLMDEGTRVIFPEGSTVEPREAELPVDDCDQWQQPDAQYEERVYYHLTGGIANPQAQIVNPRFPIGGELKPVRVTLSWFSDELTHLVQWKMPGAGTHVLGLEPANCRVDGRVRERERGTLRMLAPGESVRYELRLRID